MKTLLKIFIVAFISLILGAVMLDLHINATAGAFLCIGMFLTFTAPIIANIIDENR